MKKIIVLLSVLIFAVSTNAQSIKVTATQRAGYSIDTTDFWLNPVYIQYVTKATNPLIGYINVPKADSTITYKVVSTIPFDSIVNRCNRAFAYLVKLQGVSLVSGTSRDTGIVAAYPLTKFVEVKAKTDAARPKTKSTVGAKQDNKAGYIRWDILETPAIIKLRIDSLIRVARDSSY